MQEPDECGTPPGAAGGNPSVEAGLARRIRRILGVLRFRAFDTSTADGRSLERYRRIALTTVSGVAVRVFAALLGLVTVPLVLRYLGKDLYGLWTIVITVVAWISLFDLGLAGGLVNLLSAAHGRDDAENAASAASTAFVSLLAMAALLLALVLASLSIVPWARLLGATSVADESTVRYSIAAALSLFALSLPFSVTQQIYAAYQRTYVWNAFVLAGAILGFVGLVIGIHVDLSLPSLILAYGVAGTLGTVAAYFYATRRALPWLRPRLGKVSRPVLRALFARSAPIFLYQVGALVVNESQSILLAHRCDLATVTAYSIGMRVYLLVIAVIQLGTNSFIPALREAYERGDRAWTFGAFARLLRVRTAMAAAGGLAVVLLGNWVLFVWLRRTDIAFGREVWVVMALLMVGAMWSTSYAELLSIMDRLWINVVAVLCNGAVTLTLTYYLSYRYQVFGALLALAIPTALVTIVLRIYGRRFLASADLHGAAHGAGT